MSPDVPITNEFSRWIARLSDAGATVPVLLFLSILAVACIAERVVSLRRSRIAPGGLLPCLLPLFEAGKHGEILDMAGASRSVLGRIVAFMVTNRHWPVAELSMSAGDLAGRELRRHLIRAYPLAVVGALAPLLGLLGTVSGMVDAFDAVAVAGLGDVQVLGSSISKALVTTMVGLVVAIPSLFAYHIFKSRTQLYGVLLEEQSSALVSAWFMKETRSDSDKEAGDADAR